MKFGEIDKLVKEHEVVMRFTALGLSFEAVTDYCEDKELFNDFEVVEIGSGDDSVVVDVKSPIEEKKQVKVMLDDDLYILDSTEEEVKALLGEANDFCFVFDGCLDHGNAVCIKPLAHSHAEVLMALIKNKNICLIAD